MNYSGFIIVVGLSGVGKTTFCSYLADLSGFNVINSGSAMREMLTKKGIKVLKRIETGDIFLKHYSEAQLFEVVHNYAITNHANIIDGIRLPSTLNYFQSLYTSSYIIFIETRDSLRKERVLNRLLMDDENISTTNEIINEKDSYYNNINLLKKHSNFIVENNDSDLYNKAKIVWQQISQQIY